MSPLQPVGWAVAAPRVSVVIPMHNEEDNARPLFARLHPILERLGETYEVIAVDDGSTDATLSILCDLERRLGGLRVICLSRNFGQHAAVMAGFAAARGEWIITLDADLQNPPEEIPKLIEALRGGADLVNTYRAVRRDGWFRRLASRLINRIVASSSGIELQDFGCMLRGYHRSVAESLARRHQHRTFIPALAMMHARYPVEISVEHESRASGASKYSFWRLFVLQLDLVLNFAIGAPRVLFGLGAVVSLVSLAFGGLLLALRLLYGREWAAEGVFTLFAVLFFFVGAQFAAFGLLGEYLARIYQVILDRPAYLVRDVPAAGAAAPRGPGERRLEPSAESRS